MKESYKLYVLTETEYKILLNRCGTDGVFGFVDSLEEKESKEKIYQTLSGMVNKGYLLNENEKFVVAEDMKELIQRIVSADSIISITLNNEKKKEYICYILADGVVLISKSEVRKNSMIFEYMDKDLYENEFCKDIGPGYSVEYLEKNWEVK